MLATDRTDDGGLVFGLRVSAGAGRNRVKGLYGDRLKVSVTAPPERGKANDAICELLADWLDINARNVAITSGETSPDKRVTVYGVSEQELQDKTAET